MKYEAPEVTALASAINAVQTLGTKSIEETHADSPFLPDSGVAAYQDWE